MPTVDSGSTQDMNTLRTEDVAVRNALSVLEQHTSFMKSMSGTVQTIREDINNSYQARSSTTFQNKVNEWIENYMAVQSAVQTLQENLQSAHQIISQAEEQITSQAGGWSTQDGSGPYYQALHG